MRKIYGQTLIKAFPVGIRIIHYVYICMFTYLASLRDIYITTHTIKKIIPSKNIKKCIVNSSTKNIIHTHIFRNVYVTYKKQQQLTRFILIINHRKWFSLPIEEIFVLLTTKKILCQFWLKQVWTCRKWSVLYSMNSVSIFRAVLDNMNILYTVYYFYLVEWRYR